MNDSPGSSPHDRDSSPHSFALSRRAVVKLGLVGVLGAAVGTGSASIIKRLSTTTPRTYRCFTPAEADLLVEICEQLIPRDDAPGATETGAIDYIDRQLCGVFADHQQTYRRGLEAFRVTCLQAYQKPFRDLPAATKIAALSSLEAGHAPTELWRDPSAPAFFNLVLAHTMQGFYGSPRHGGNRGYASYRMLGLDAPQVLGRNRYRST